MTISYEREIDPSELDFNVDVTPSDAIDNQFTGMNTSYNKPDYLAAMEANGIFLEDEFGRF